MSKRIFNLVYYIDLFFFLCGSSLYLGPVTAGFFFAAILLLLILLHDKKLVLDKPLKLYAVFILSFGFSSLVTGQMRAFSDTFLRFYLISFILWRATSIAIENNPKAIDTIFYMFLCIGLFDVAVSISQMTFNTQWYQPIYEALKLRHDEEMAEVMANKSQYSDVFSYAITGIFGNAIKNGWFLAVCSCLSMRYVLKYKKLVLLVFPMIYIAGVFACQERSAFLGSILALVYCLYRLYKNGNIYAKVGIVLFSALAVVIGIDYLVAFSESNNLRYTEFGFDDTGRSVILSDISDYLMSNPIFPNIYDHFASGGRAPHNLFVNAFMYGGILSFICILYILMIQFKSYYQDIKNNLIANPTLMAIILSAFVFTFNSLFHNQSVVTGEYVIWILWAMYLSEKVYNKTGK